jgi:transketolase
VPQRFRHLCATAPHFERYGSQGFMRKQSGLDPASLLAAVSAV